MKSLKKYADELTEMFVKNMVEKKVVRVRENSDEQNPVYEFISDTQNKQGNTSKTMSRSQRVIRSFYDFRNFANIISSYLFTGFSNTNRLSERIQFLGYQGAFRNDWEPLIHLNEVLDKADDLFGDDETRRISLDRLRNAQIHFPKLNNELLEFLTIRLFNQYLPEFKATRLSGNEGADIKLTRYGYSGFNIFVEVKFRSRDLGLEDAVPQLFNVIKDSSNGSGNSDRGILVIYTQDNLSQQERYRFRFSSLMHTDTGSLYREKISLLLIGLNFFKEVHNAMIELRKGFGLHSLSVYELRNSKPPDPEIRKDAQAVGRSFSLANHDYEIIFEPKRAMQYWRVGLRFSPDSKFPEPEPRHVEGFPLFALCKNKEDNMITYALFNRFKKRERADETPLKKNDVKEIIMLIRKMGEIYRIDAYDYHREAVVEGITFELEHFFQIMAWADGVNDFDFRVTVVEHPRKSS